MAAMAGRFLGSTVLVSMLGIASTFSPSSLSGLALRGGRPDLLIRARESKDWGLNSVFSILHKHNARLRTGNISLNMCKKELTDKEREEYEKLLEEAKRIQGTFNAMIGNAFAGQPEPEPEPEQQEPVQQKKGFDIPIEEPAYEEESLYTPEVNTEESEPVDLSTMTDEERAAYEMSRAQTLGDEAFEGSDAAIRMGDKARALELHNFQRHPNSIFRPSFMDSLKDQQARIDKMP
ncbi:hypothetical protein GUITHDRAFT_140314 [Guillardia theta CCMP2712]|uniref:Uncharacterized protein n=1 Tax=Guillardia theta (strain CCMP2712) TaxID=905079 RepID=L1J5C0_GUITC|nr:hypothetical protein GUITHDRAFT_140314 [Guillardia theta CCMP2712]EKX43537.1 hypothetical protein GUITHDRAFT_140314 [Guillardia theta CCMP2712]|eukprot:XP_005830517.1 hypothetical protein GUITHDRAFT_140314 [Guillardia theta CCMP2712]